MGGWKGRETGLTCLGPGADLFGDDAPQLFFVHLPHVRHGESEPSSTAPFFGATRLNLSYTGVPFFMAEAAAITASTICW